MTPSNGNSVLYILFLMLPIRLIAMIKTTGEILKALSFFPQTSPLKITPSYSLIRPGTTVTLIQLVSGVINTIISVTVALPAASAFHDTGSLATSTCSSGCSPTAWLLLRYLHYLFSSCIQLSACSIPILPWLLPTVCSTFPWLCGFLIMSGVPKELDETAFLDGYSYWRFLFAYLFRLLLPVSVSRCSSVSCIRGLELLLAKTLTSVDAKPIAATMTRTASSSSYELGHCPLRAHSPSFLVQSSSTLCVTISPKVSPWDGFSQRRTVLWAYPGWHGPGRLQLFSSRLYYQLPPWAYGDG